MGLITLHFLVHQASHSGLSFLTGRHPTVLLWPYETHHRIRSEAARRSGQSPVHCNINNGSLYLTQVVAVASSGAKVIAPWNPKSLCTLVILVPAKYSAPLVYQGKASSVVPSLSGAKKQQGRASKEWTGSRRARRRSRQRGARRGRSVSSSRSASRRCRSSSSWPPGGRPCPTCGGRWASR